ncbi:hypothetical protein SDC9_152749 [bioreactor metagenome]|uniref:Uncharacterized protein n=1 Tax=bioreactor metagenome TaxID=1076179 RepID=A0A645ETY0_9ZZZZ
MLFGHAELDHQAAQELGFQLRIDRAGLPHGGVLLLGAVDLDHAAMADEDVGAAVLVALKARAEAVTLAGGVQAVEQFADGRADDVLRDLGAVFGPVGLQDAEFGVVGGEDKAAFQPEVAHRIPQLVGGAVDHQPALVAIALDAHVADGGGCCVRAAGLLCLACLIGDGRGGAARHGVARVARELGQVGRHFQCRALLGTLVVDLVALQNGAGRQGQCQAEQAESSRSVHAKFLMDLEVPLDGRA